MKLPSAPSTLRGALLLLFAAGTVSACSTTIEADDYNRSCNIAEDCVAILVGDACGCDCTFGAINKGDFATEQEDRDGIGCTGPVDCGPCPNAPAAACINSVCETQ